MLGYMIRWETFPLGYQQSAAYRRHQFTAQDNESAVAYFIDFFYGDPPTDAYLFNSAGANVHAIRELNRIITPLFEEILEHRGRIQWWKRRKFQARLNGESENIIESITHTMTELKVLIQNISSKIRYYKPKY